MSLVRQQSLLGIEGSTGLGCFDLQDAVAQNVIDVCTKSIWTGTISIKEDGATNITTVYTNGQQQDTDTYHFSAAAFATNSTEQIIDGFGLMATVNLAGHATVRSLRDRYSENYDRCGTLVSDDKTEASGDADVVYRVNLSEQQGTNYNITIVFLGSGDTGFGITARERNERVSTTPPGIGCSGMERQFASSESTTQFSSQQLAGFSGTLSPGATNSIAGSTAFMGSFGSAQTQVTISWNLTRSKVQ